MLSSNHLESLELLRERALALHKHHTQQAEPHQRLREALVAFRGASFDNCSSRAKCRVKFKVDSTSARGDSHREALRGAGKYLCLGFQLFKVQP